MVSEEIVADMDVARKILFSESCSIVVIKNGKMLSKKQGAGIRPILEVVDELGETLKDTIIGDRILGKASALLCVYSKVSGVYTPQATRTGLAVLIIAGIPSQTDQLIPFIKNRNGDDICPFEKLLADIDSAEEAYQILHDEIAQKNSGFNQKMTDPFSNKDVTGDYIEESRKEMEKNLQDIFLKAKAKLADEQKPENIYNEFLKQIELVIEKYYRGMKLPADQDFIKKNIEKLSEILGIERC